MATVQSQEGIQNLGAAAPTQIDRADRTGAKIVQLAHGDYTETVRQGNMFTMTLNATTTGVAAGNIVGAAAAASTNFALFNPVGSGKVLYITKFGMGIISGTPGAGPLFYGIFTTVPTATASATIRNNLLGGAGSVALGYAVAAGVALTAGTAPLVHSMANFTTTATAQATVGEIAAVEELKNAIAIPAGYGFLPLWSAAGTALLNGYSITWEELSA